jgi:hypothetical protein
MNHCSRRKFMLTAGAATAGILTHGCTATQNLAKLFQVSLFNQEQS